MNIEISDDRRIKEIQDEFSAAFPWLKLEFFTKPHTAGEASAKKDLIDPSHMVGKVRTIHKSGAVTIIPGMTVAHLEKVFREMYGLSVQVFRKSGDVWLETTTTDSWTLEHQNAQGQIMSEPV